MTKSFTTYITFTNTANFFKSGEGYTLNNRRSHTGGAMQSFDVFGKHLTTVKMY
jgi:hypothetical protein